MTSTGPESAGLIQPQRETRSSSLRNLVTNQSNPSSKSILGKADAAALITVNASPGEGGGVANRHTDRWARDIDTANASGAIWQPTDVLSSLNGSLAREQGVVLAEPAQQDFVYDSDGSLLDDGTRQFGWNAQGQCVTQSLANVTNAPATHPVSATHVYDWMGRRAISTFTRADGSTGQLLTVFDRYDPILEEDETGKQQAHVCGINRRGQGKGATLGSTLLWSATSTDSRTLYAKTDAGGNVNAWYDGQSQVAARTYSPFGEVLEESGESWPVSFGFSTKREFGGLNDYGFRWYRAEFGAWLSSDPIMENGGGNINSFLGNKPMALEDLLGLQEIDISGLEKPKPNPIKPLPILPSGNPFVCARVRWDADVPQTIQGASADGGSWEITGFPFHEWIIFIDNSGFYHSFQVNITGGDGGGPLLDQWQDWEQQLHQ